MPKFDMKVWNDNVFQKYMRKIPNLKENTMIKNGVLVVNNTLKSRLVDGVGGNKLTEPIKGLVEGDYVNYDGNTDITTSSRNTFSQTKIVVGRAKGWEEKDFSTDISGEDYMPVASEVAEYFQNVDEETILAILKGIFSMTDTAGKDFISKHTYEVAGNIDATTINNAATKGFGDKKRFVSMAFMHSIVAGTLENLQMLEYVKYTSPDGIQTNIGIAQQGNKMVIIDDDMPTQDGYFAATAQTAGALQVVSSGAVAGTSILLADVKKASFYPSAVAANDYVVEGTKYTSYLLGKGSLEYCDIGAKVPSEVDRDPAKNGGVDKLYTRQRKLYAPQYISWIGANSIISPLKSDLENGANWEIVNDGETSKTYVNHKLLPFAQIITRG